MHLFQIHCLEQKYILDMAFVLCAEIILPLLSPQKSYMGDKSWRVKLHLATLPFLTPTLLWRVLSITNSQV